MKLALRVFLILIFFLISVHSVWAETTSYRSAGTITTDGNTPYTNLVNCSATDGNTCDHASAPLFANLYFRDFGDFGIPDGSTITHLKIRVTGKASLPTQALFAGVSIVGSPILFASNCQAPSDLWTMSVLNSTSIATYNVTTPLTNGSLATCLSLAKIESSNFIFRINYSKSVAWSANIDNFEIAFDYTPGATPTPTPTPAGPEPFLDLPWDYEGQGQTFSEAALSIKSFFDHEYPLLGNLIAEPAQSLDTLVSFDGITYTQEQRSYSSHDGYDYGSPAKVEDGDFVLAPASGIATVVLEKNSGGAGNVIKIDHGNGYQTWYEHLYADGLIVATEGSSKNVNKGDRIGKVGHTGNCYVFNSEGKRAYNTPSCAHIHFGVFQDKNNDGNFEDNVPDGVTDPFGWQSKDPDPWENYLFFYGGLQKTGNKSYYLWKKSIGGTSSNIGSSGGNVSAGRYTAEFPGGAVSQNTIIEFIPEPIVSVSNVLTSIGPTLLATAKDSIGNAVTNFLEPFALTVNFSDIDLSRYNLSSLSIYSSQDGQSWNKELTDIDFLNHTATTSIAHFTHFALLAERLDTTAPETNLALSGDYGQENQFRSDVVMSINTQDNEGGLGVDFMAYKIDGNDWQEYKTPVVFHNGGHYKVEFYSEDLDENIEDVQSIEFNIDKISPEAEIKFNPETLDIDIIGHDSSGSATIDVFGLPKNKNSIKITDQAGNILEIIGKDKDKGRNAKITIESLQYNEGSLINVGPTKLLINYNLDNNSAELRKLIQTFEIKGELKIKLVYSSKADKTQVITKVKGQEKVKEELSGIRILKLTTENGTLNYSY